MIKDMTKGTPWKLIFAFMVPVCCGNIFQNFYDIEFMVPDPNGI